MGRTFEDKPAVRERTPLLIGIIGPSGTGKTYSALRLATGIQRVSGGEIFGIDTEARRMLHYSEKFKFRHVAFGAPFSPLDYLAAIEHCMSRGAKVIIVDSMSHEHEGPGGVLEMHEKEMGGDFKKSMLAWQKPKAQRRRMINSILQMECDFIFCFRAKEKFKLVTGKEPEPRGYVALAGEEFIYEMTVSHLLIPGADGTPTVESGYPGEREMIKTPTQFRGLLVPSKQLCEDTGEAMARWAAGSAAPPVVTAAALVQSYEACADATTMRALKDQRTGSWRKFSKDEQELVRKAAEAAQKRIDDAQKASESIADPGDAGGPDDATAEALAKRQGAA